MKREDIVQKLLDKKHITSKEAVILLKETQVINIPFNPNPLANPSPSPSQPIPNPQYPYCKTPSSQIPTDFNPNN